MQRLPRQRKTHGNLKTWVASLGLTTLIWLPPEVEFVEPVDVSPLWKTLMLSSTTSPSSLGRRRAAILTLWLAMGEGRRRRGLLAVGEIVKRPSPPSPGVVEQARQSRGRERVCDV